ncbi:MAG: hypothetical protein IPO92_11715 [Saprospiraceae bacterium]|nr:hypothetical protein [Saprospiraceae bacterium]
MRVTDCAMFGDFLKLEPRISFFKDIFLLLPAFYFLFFTRSMHQLFSRMTRNIIIGGSTILLFLYCIYNFHWDEPHVDFRPFRNGANIAAIKKAEMEASAAVKVLAMKMKNKKNGEIKLFTYDEYLKNLSAITDEYETIEQIKTEPTIKETKISHFDITDFDGNEKTNLYLSNPEPHLMIVVYKADYKAIENHRTIQDTLYLSDTIAVSGYKDSMQIVKSIKEIKNKDEVYYDIEWNPEFLATFINVIKPLNDAAAKDNVKMSVVISGVDAEKAATLAKESGINAEFLTADEKLLKTMMRSNPGIVLWKNGVLLHKWHFKKLPEWQTIKENFLK